VVVKIIDQVSLHPQLDIEPQVRVIDPDGRKALLLGNVAGLPESLLDGEPKVAGHIALLRIVERAGPADGRLGLAGGVVALYDHPDKVIVPQLGLITRNSDHSRHPAALVPAPAWTRPQRYPASGEISLKGQLIALTDEVTSWRG
jgi:hypothetical protein